MLNGFRLTFITTTDPDFQPYCLQTLGYGLFGSLEYIRDWMNDYGDDLKEFGLCHLGKPALLRHTDIGLRADEIQINPQSKLAGTTSSLRSQDNLLVDVDAFCLVKAFNPDAAILFQTRTAVVLKTHSIDYSKFTDEAGNLTSATPTAPEAPNWHQQKPSPTPLPPTHG